MDIYSAIFPGPREFWKRKFFEMAMEKFRISVRENSKIC